MSIGHNIGIHYSHTQQAQALTPTIKQKPFLCQAGFLLATVKLPDKFSLGLLLSHGQGFDLYILAQYDI